MINFGDLEGRARGGRRAAIAALVGVLAVAGCNSSKKKSHPSAPPTTAATQPSPFGTPSADITAIKSAYLRFFNPKTSVADSIGLVQDGPAFAATLAAQAKTAQAQNSTATISKVTLQSANVGLVTFSILISGSPVLVNTTGFAVREGGTWKVAGTTFCGLLTLDGSAPAACSSTAATSLPS